MQLVIVESPTKARKLSQFLGANYQVEASIGHVIDLPKSKLGVDVENNFAPVYELDPKKKDILRKLTQLGKKADQIYLATDPDREGEAIAWHLSEALKKSIRSDLQFHRATFHEITKTAVQEAINNPSSLNVDLVNAQQARRILDRLVGYQVSPVLWKKIRRGLSAGRVQSVALRLIVEREREIEAFVAEEYWEVAALLQTEPVAGTEPEVLLAEEDRSVEWLKQPGAKAVPAAVTSVDGQDFQPTTRTQVEPVLRGLAAASYQVTNVDRKQRERASLPPFTTSTLQQAAASRFGFTSKQTMSLAQQLYEEGLITYHRTDSVTLSQAAIGMLRDYALKRFGNELVSEKTRQFRTKTKNAQEAHEGIRITNPEVSAEAVMQVMSRATERHRKLYDLIWRRSVATQMRSAVYEQTAVTITATSTTANTFKTALLKANGSVLKNPGWLQLFDSQDDVILPSLTPAQELFYNAAAAQQKFTQPPPRYNDASLVKELEKRGIGRPSTYASIISVLEDRGYIDRKDRRFFATAIGKTVNDFLVKYFSAFMEYNFTAEMEEDLDRISRGEKAWQKVIGDFFKPFDQTVQTVTKDAERMQVPVEKTGRSCPLCGDTEGGEVVIRMGKFGKFLSCSRFPDCKFTEKIVEKLADQHCPLCQQGEVIVKNTRWGRSFYGCSRYPECNWASWQPPKPGQVITPEEWAEQQAARKARAEKRAKTMGKKTTAKKSKTVKSAKPRRRTTKRRKAA